VKYFKRDSRHLSPSAPHLLTFAAPRPAEADCKSWIKIVEQAIPEKAEYLESTLKQVKQGREASLKAIRALLMTRQEALNAVTVRS